MTKINALFATALLAVSLNSQTALAADAELSNWDDAVFSSVDLNNDKKISRQEILHFTDSAFYSM